MSETIKPTWAEKHLASTGMFASFFVYITVAIALHIEWDNGIIFLFLISPLFVTVPMVFIGWHLEGKVWDDDGKLRTSRL